MCVLNGSIEPANKFLKRDEMLIDKVKSYELIGCLRIKVDIDYGACLDTFLVNVNERVSVCIINTRAAIVIHKPVAGNCVSAWVYVK
jgi:hypothetical protein